MIRLRLGCVYLFLVFVVVVVVVGGASRTWAVTPPEAQIDMVAPRANRRRADARRTEQVQRPAPPRRRCAAGRRTVRVVTGTFALPRRIGLRGWTGRRRERVVPSPPPPSSASASRDCIASAAAAPPPAATPIRRRSLRKEECSSSAERSRTCTGLRYIMRNDGTRRLMSSAAFRISSRRALLDDAPAPPPSSAASVGGDETDRGAPIDRAPPPTIAPVSDPAIVMAPVRDDGMRRLASTAARCIESYRRRRGGGGLSSIADNDALPAPPG